MRGCVGMHNAASCHREVREKATIINMYARRAGVLEQYVQHGEQAQ